MVKIKARGFVGVVSALSVLTACEEPPSNEGCPWSDAAQNGALVLRGASLFTAVDDAVQENFVVVVQDQRILCVVPEPETLPEGMEVLDLDGLTLLPGLVDAHVHVALHATDLSEPMDLFIDNGVTTIRDVGSSLDRIIELRDQVDDGVVQGPRILTSGPLITAPGGHPVATLWPGNDELAASAGREIAEREEAREVVRALAAANVDLVKLVLTECNGSSLGPCARLETAVFAAAVDEALSLGLSVAVHTNGEQDVVDAIEAGVTSVEHGYTEGELSDELLSMIIGSGVWYVPTIAVLDLSAAAEVEDIHHNVGLLREAGAPVALGTDAWNPGIVWGEAVHLELEHMVTSGFSPAEALIAATRSGAELLGLDEEIGTLEVGRQADLVAVGGNPTEDISVTSDIRLVIRGGEILRNELD